LEAALDAIITIDQQETIVHFNRAAQELFGYSGQEAKGRKLTDLLIPKDRRPTQSDLFGRCLSQGSELVLVQRLELVVRRSSGEEFPIEMTVVRLPAEGPVSYRCHVRDLTDQKNAEAALRASEERYRDLVENANDIIYTHDLAGNLMSWNRAGERMLGYTMEDIRGMNISQIVVPEQLERAKQMTSRKMAEGGRTAYELDVLTKDGKKLTVEISSRLASQPGQSPLVYGMARDVTERKRAEEALKEADRKKDEFLATLAHELRNPLAPIATP
jgi:PAS domain S-box-containing protein